LFSKIFTKSRFVLINRFACLAVYGRAQNLLAAQADVISNQVGGSILPNLSTLFSILRNSMNHRPTDPLKDFFAEIGI